VRQLAPELLLREAVALAVRQDPLVGDRHLLGLVRLLVVGPHAAHEPAREGLVLVPGRHHRRSQGRQGSLEHALVLDLLLILRAQCA